MQTDLTQFIREKVNALHSHWKASLRDIFGRLNLLGDDPSVFGELRGLLLDLVALVERSESVEQAVDAELASIVNHLKALQANQGLSSTEMVLLLFAMRDSIRKAIQEIVDHGIEGQHWVSAHFQV